MTSDPEALARLALELVAVPSATGEEAALADLVEARCRALPGVAVERLGNSLVARVGERDDAVALVGHLDTVPPWDGSRAGARGHARDRPRRRRHEGRRRGHPGGARALRATAGARVVCVFYDREEGPNRENGIHAVLAESRLLGRPAFAFVGEPTGCDVHAGCVGVRQRRPRLPRPHGAQRAARGRATARCSAPCRSWSARRARRNGPVEVEGLTFHDTLCITQIHGGVARNVVPDRVELALNVRFAPGREAAAARARDRGSSWRARAS